MKIIVNERRDRATELARLNKTPGSRRREFVTALEAMPEGVAVMRVPYGPVGVHLDKRGNVIVVDKDNPSGLDGALVHPQLVATLVAGAVYANKMIGSVFVPCGTAVLIGGGGSGKTPSSHALAAANVESYEAVRVGEPLAGYVTTQYLAAVELGRALLSGSDIVLDSMKDLLAGGAAMKSGISREALIAISAWSVIAIACGSTIYVPLNPSTKDTDVVDLLVEASKSNATMTIYGGQGDTWAYEARTGEGRRRSNGSFVVKYDDAGVPDIVGATAPTGKPLGVDLVHGVKTNASFSTIVRRSIEAVKQ